MRFMFSKEDEEEEEDEESVKIMFYLYFVPCVIISYNFLHAVTFCHVLHLNVIRSQIKLKLKVKTVNILMYGYNAGQPMAIPIYTVPYCVIYIIIYTFVRRLAL